MQVQSEQAFTWHNLCDNQRRRKRRCGNLKFGYCTVYIFSKTYHACMCPANAPAPIMLFICSHGVLSGVCGMVCGENTGLRWVAVPPFYCSPFYRCIGTISLERCMYPCHCAAHPRDPEIEPKAFFSHTQQILAGESGSNASFLVEAVTNALAKRGGVATFYDINDFRPRLGIPLAPQIAKAAKRSRVSLHCDSHTSLLATFLAHVRAASSA